MIIAAVLLSQAENDNACTGVVLEIHYI